MALDIICILNQARAMAAGGIWMPEPAVLAGIRQEIDYNLC